MSPKQKKLAAKAPPPNVINEKDFAVLRAEKKKVKPVKAALGLALGVLGAAGAKKLMKKKSTMNPGVTSSKMPINLVEEYKKAKGLQNGGVTKANLGLMFMKKAKDKGAKGMEFLSPLAMLKRVSGRKAGGVAKYKRGMGPGGLDLPVISSVKPGSKIGKGKKTYSSMEEMRKAKGFKPGESASEFNKRRKALSVAKNVASKTRIGKIALGVGAAGVAAQQYLKSKMKKKDEPKKKMGGGMMKKYSKGGGADTGKQGEMKSKIAVGTMRVNKILGRLKDRDRLTQRDIEASKELLNQKKFTKRMGGGMMNKPMGYKSGSKLMDFIKSGSYTDKYGTKTNVDKAIKKINLSPKDKDLATMKPASNKKMMGGGMMQKPMGYSKGTMIKARGCKLGRTRPTKIT